MEDLFQFSKVFRRLRQSICLVEPQGEGNQYGLQFDGNTTKPTELKEFKTLLFESSILGEFINDLRARGISDPEEYAFQAICAWKPPKSIETRESPPKPSRDTELDDFLSLLIDLETGTLLPATSTSPSSSNSNYKNTQADRMKPLLASVKLNTLTARQTRELLQISQMKTALLPDLRESIERQTSEISGAFNQSGTSNRATSRRCVRRLSSKTNNNVASMEYIQASKLLLNDEKVFWEILDEAFHHRDVVAIVNEYNHMRNMQTLVEEIAHEMLLLAMDRQSFDCSLYSAEEEIQNTDGFDEERESKKTGEDRNKTKREGKRQYPEIGIVYRRKLLRLHQLLKKSRKPGSGKIRTEYFFASDQRYFTPEEKVNSELGKFPFLRKLPIEQVDKFLQTPDSWGEENRRLTALRAAAYLGVKEPEPQSLITNPEGPSISLQCKPMRVMPPNDGTMMAFHSLLLRLPDLYNSSHEFLTKLMMARRLFGYFEDTNIGSVRLPHDTLLKETLEMNWNPTLVITNPKQSAFIARCISIFLWPCIIANLPARAFIDSAIRTVEEAKKVIPMSIDPIKRVSLSHRMKRELKELDDLASFDGSRIKRQRMEDRILYNTKLKDNWISVGMELEIGNINVFLPKSVQDLLRSGFQPTQFISTVDQAS